MRRIWLTLSLLALVPWIGSAQAGSPLSSERLAKLAGISVIVPNEWDGIWTTQDSLYDCQGTLQLVLPPGADTLCGGKDYVPGNDVVCTGSATATTVNLTCDGTSNEIPDCTATIHQVTSGTRTGGTYFLVTMINVSYAGTGCSGTDPECFQLNSHGTRTGPTVPADCTPTPVRRSTWGEVKTTYR